MSRFLLSAALAAALCGGCSLVNAVPTARASDAFPVARPAAPGLSPAPGAGKPASGAEKPAPDAEKPAPGAEKPSALRRGTFTAGAHPTRGTAALYRTEAGVILRLEGFQTDNGPDLHVYLLKNADGDGRRDAEVLDLGRLRATNGDLNYDLPPAADPAAYRSVSIWCKAFSVGFGHAPLE